MLKRLKNLIGSSAANADAGPSEALSTALLLTELARSDFDLADIELQSVRALLTERYGFDGAELDALLVEARSKARDAVSLHEYVQTLNARLDEDGKRRLIEMLWQVAYADGQIDKYEEHLLRRLADLLYVPMPVYIAARQAAAADQA